MGEAVRIQHEREQANESHLQILVVESPELEVFARAHAPANVTHVARIVVASNGLLIGCITSVNGYV